MVVMTSRDGDDVTRYQGNDTGLRRKTLPKCSTTKMVDIRNKYKILRSGEGVRSGSVSEDFMVEDDEEMLMMHGVARALSLPTGRAGSGDGEYNLSPGFSHYVRRSSFDPYSMYCMTFCDV